MSNKTYKECSAEGNCGSCSLEVDCLENQLEKAEEKITEVTKYLKKIIISDQRRSSLDLTLTYLAQRALNILGETNV